MAETAGPSGTASGAGEARLRRRLRYVGVAVMAVVAVLFVGFAVYYAVVLFRFGGVVGGVMGAALLVFAGLGAWWIWSDLAFGVRAERLRDRFDREPEDGAAWRDQMRAALELDAAGDAKGCRSALREAIRRSRRP